MMERRFRLKDNQTTIRMEIGSGATVFLTALYILFVNRIVLADAGMPPQGVFVATALSAAICTLGMALYTNLPFVVAPAMSINSFFAYTICVGAGYHWKEALAISFLAGILHVVLMLTPLRKSMLVAIPEHLGLAAGAALGLFIAGVAVRNMGIFSSLSELTGAAGGAASAGSLSTANIFSEFDPASLIPIVAAATLVILLSFEQKTGEKFAALPVSILAATFLCLPMNLERLHDIAGVSGSAFDEYKEMIFSFFHVPGLGSLFSNPVVATKSVLIILLLSMTNILDSIGTIIGIGYMQHADLFERRQMELFKRRNTESKLDRALIANSFGGVLAPLFGTSTATIYLESSAGILFGGRTGLAGVVTGLMFLLCIPFAGVFRVIPVEAVAPAMIYVGASTMSRLRNIDWTDVREGIPAFVIMLFTLVTNSILDGMCIGILCYIMTSIATGNRRRVSAVLYLIGIVYVLIKIAEKLL